MRKEVNCKMKLCKDCKWCDYIPESNGYMSMCKNERIINKSPVTGKVNIVLCNSAREGSYNRDVLFFCRDGEFFEEKL